MPRRRTRKTNWQPQDQRQLRIRAIRRETPDARKLSRAFIGLALARAEAEQQAQAEAEQRAEGRTGSGDGTDANSDETEDGDVPE